MRTIFVLGRNHQEVDRWMWEVGNTRFKGGVVLQAINSVDATKGLPLGSSVVCLDGAGARGDWHEMKEALTWRDVKWLEA